MELVSKRKRLRNLLTGIKKCQGIHLKNGGNIILEYRERNGNKHIVSDNELNAFAWAGYYANYSTILINGKSYEVVHVTDSEIEFADGTCLPFGCYAIFKSDDELKFFDDYKLREVRKENPLEHEYYCFNDDQFLKVA
nr:MAG TPA: hypothetical protein [Caudoviricetes sp.]